MPHPLLTKVSIKLPEKKVNAYLLLERKINSGKKSVSYEGLPPIATIIRSGVAFEEFMDKLYLVTGYEKQYMSLAMTCRYLVIKEYITLTIID